MVTILDTKTAPQGPRHPEKAGRPDTPVLRKPDWIRVKAPGSKGYAETREIVKAHGLTTVCEEAGCPNIGECWEKKHATMMILGDTCTRACAFCNVKTGLPGPLDADEPRRVGDAVAKLGLAHVVITSVDRDDLADGGSGIFARTIRAIRHRSPGTTIEVLTPDFQGDLDAVRTVVDAGPNIFNHNTETVPRLYARIRPKAVYANSLALLRHVKQLSPSMVTKSGLMVGLGETEDELLDVFCNMRAHNIDVLTVGQYLRPTKKHAEVVRYYRPEEFARLREQAVSMGFRHVEAGPLVRSSYHADEQVPAEARKSLLAG